MTNSEAEEVADATLDSVVMRDILIALAKGDLSARMLFERVDDLLYVIVDDLEEKRKNA